MRNRIKYTLIIFSSAIAAIGTYPYARDFASSVFPTPWAFLLGTFLFVPAALFANMALGTFSLLDSLRTSKDMSILKLIFISLIALLASSAVGFICFVGYRSTLPLQLNLLISMMVVLVNAAIGFSAINNAANHFFVKRVERSVKNDSTRTERYLINLTIVGAFITSCIFYLATMDGLLSIALHYHYLNPPVHMASHLLSIIVWLPDAALFIYASSITVGQSYRSFRQNGLSLSLMSCGILIIAISSGSALAQMALEFFDAEKKIPGIFRHISSYDTLVFYCIMPIAFIISAAVNAFALSNAFSRLYGTED